MARSLFTPRAGSWLTSEGIFGLEVDLADLIKIGMLVRMLLTVSEVMVLGLRS